MPAPRSVSKLLLRSLFVLTLFDAAVFSQTSLNDVHIASRETSSHASAMNSSIQLVAGTYLHVIRQNVNLVLVPVSVTDPKQRLVTGLSQENFEVFENKRAQPIQHFSSEDEP